ncbi:MAG: serine/threonine-protein phosphatase [Bacteroidales bacterium]|nr:serine/threonine-protein phosphatase [Bacteroidales bacterium]
MLKQAAIRRLQLCNFKLDTLLEFTQAINANVSTPILLARYEKLLKEELKIGKVIIFNNYEGIWKIILKSGFEHDKVEKIDITKELLKITEITMTLSEEYKLFRTFDIIIPVFHNKRAIAYLLIGDIDEEQDGVSPTIKHLHFIQTLTNIIMVAVENKRLFHKSLQQEALKKELILASNIQSMLIPDASIYPQNEKFFISSFYLPHFEVGGDYFDFIQFNENEIGFCIADVSGKGIAAALLMSNFQANFNALFTADMPLDVLIKRLNKIISKNAQGQKFITFFVAKYNYETKILEYVNAGHNPPILYNKATKESLHLMTGCMGLGMLDEIPSVKVGIKKISTGMQGAKLLCYTDGLIEIKHDNEIETRLNIIEYVFSTPDRIDNSIQELLEQLNIKRDNSEFFDDITILGVELY